ncbi:MAG: ABC transporter permease [Candidatus Woesearchaeota archaeon]
MIQDYLKLTFKNLKNRKVRSWLTILGVVIGIATIVALVSIGQGLQNAIEVQFQRFGTRTLMVLPGGANGPPSQYFFLTQDTADFLGGVKGVDYVSPLLTRSTTVEYRREQQFLAINGLDPVEGTKTLILRDSIPIEGRHLQKGDKYTAVIGYKVATDTFNQDIQTKTSILINNQKFKVEGIIKETGGQDDSNIYIPIETARELFGAGDQVNVIAVTIKEGLDIHDVQMDIERKLDRKLGEDSYTVYTPDQILKQIGSVIGVVQAVLVAIAAISILVGAVGIMNSMYTSVLERTREIGVMKGIGASKATILTIFLLESGFQGLAGGIIGAAIGMILAKGTEIGAKLAGFDLLLIKFDPTVILFALAFAMIIGMASGFFPAWRASKLNPVDALHYE